MQVISTLPYSLSIPGGASLFAASGAAYHHAIDSIPFLSAARESDPEIRRTAPFRKQQFDNSNEPGEQSLEGWWIRSQQSFHGGAGQLYEDPGDEFSSVRFFDSVGVDPWTPGELRLLPSTSQVDGVSLYRLITTEDGDAFGYIQTIGADDQTWILDGVTDDITLGDSPTEAPTDIAHGGGFFWVSGADGIWKSTDGDSWSLVWNAPGATSRIAWVKGRLIMASSGGVFELVGSGPSLPSAVWTPPTGTTWTPTAITEAAGFIYVAGNQDILRFGLGDDATLSAGVQVAKIPLTERLRTISDVFGRFLAIGTFRGLRIAAIGADGTLELGPQMLVGLSVTDFTTEGQYLYSLGFDETIPSDSPRDIYRIDMGTQVEPLRFAYARDLRVENPGAFITLVTSYGLSNQIVLGGPPSPKMLIATDNGVFKRDDTYVSEGYLQTSRIRFGTLEPKLFKKIRIRGPQTEADFFVSVIDSADNEADVVGYVDSQTPGLTDVALPNLGPQDFISVKFTLNSTDDNSASAQLSGYQLKALPGTPRQRLIELPLFCFDLEKDRNGVVAGYKGWCRERRDLVEILNESGDTVSYQDLDAGTTETVMIEDYQFHQHSPPDGPNGFGGILRLLLRTT